MNSLIPQLVQELERAPTEKEMMQAMDTLVQMGEQIVPDLLQSMKDFSHHKGLRQAITQILQRIGYPANEAAIPFLVGIVSDINSPGWETALSTLKEAGEPILPEVHEALQFYLKDYNEYASYFQGLCILLEQMGSSAIDPLLPDLLQLLELGTDENFLDEYALWPIRKIGSPKANAAVPILQRIIRAKRRGSIKAAAIMALQDFDTPIVRPLVPVLFECLSDQPKAVQESARKILSLLGELD